MNEEFLHFVWKYRLFDTKTFIAPTGEPIEIIRTGEPNNNAGPDFLNCRIRIGETQWAGNAEIHLRSSDWNRHGHNNDKAYDNVILHLVHIHDKEVLDSAGNAVPTYILKSNELLIQNYSELKNKKSSSFCSEKFSLIDSFLVSQWLGRMMIERLEERSQRISESLTVNKGDWQETFYRNFFAAFGMKVNQQPFEMMAISLPFKILQKHVGNLIQLEALLLGQAGFLSGQLFEEEYFCHLRKEYLYLQKKYSLKPIDYSLWKFMRLRPANFPGVRIAQAASMIHKGLFDFSKIIESTPQNLIQEVNQVKASRYWDNHYHFNKISRNFPKRIGADSAALLFINAIIPMIFFWASRNKNQQLMNFALNQMELLPPENNAITRKWKEMGVETKHAFDTQALIQLKNKYCDNGYCLRCAIGTRIVTRNIS